MDSLVHILGDYKQVHGSTITQALITYFQQWFNDIPGGIYRHDTNCTSMDGNHAHHMCFKDAHAHCLYFVLLAIQFSCGHLAVPDSGQFVLSNGTYIGSIVTYSCNKGYSLVGFETRFCQADRTWSGVAPTCESMLHSVMCVM